MFNKNNKSIMRECKCKVHCELLKIRRIYFKANNLLSIKYLLNSYNWTFVRRFLERLNLKQIISKYSDYFTRKNFF